MCESHSVTLVASIGKLPPVISHVSSSLPTFTAKFCDVCRVGGIDNENSGVCSVKASGRGWSPVVSADGCPADQVIVTVALHGPLKAPFVYKTLG